jgi:hypothetical protein
MRARIIQAGRRRAVLRLARLGLEIQMLTGRPRIAAGGRVEHGRHESTKDMVVVCEEYGRVKGSAETLSSDPLELGLGAGGRSE